MKSSLTSLRVGVAIWAIAVAASPGEAQTTSPNKPPPADARFSEEGSAQPEDSVRGQVSSSPGEFGDILVTARRTVERAQSIPITIQAFSADNLREAPVTGVRDLMYQVPGLYLGGSASLDNTVYAIRGNSNTGTQGHAIPGVASYFADVPLPVNAQSQPLYDIASVQVLKGPQGTLFGRNTVGGAILVYPQAPELHAIGGYVDGTIGSYDWREIQGALNIPIVRDNLAVRIAGHYSQRDGYIRNDTPGQPDQSDINNYGLRGQIRWKPSEAISNILMVDYYRSKTANSGISLVYTDDLTPVAPTVFALPAPSPPFPPGSFIPVGTYGTGHYYHTETGDVTPFSYVRQFGITNHTDVDLGSVQLTNIFAYRKARFDSDQSADGTSIAVLDAQQRTNEEQFTEELQLKGDLSDGRIRWLLGGFYLRSNPLQGNASLNQVLPFLAGPGVTSYSFNTQTSKALFGNLIVDLETVTTGLSLNGGLRYTWDSYKLCTAVASPTSPYNAAPFSLRPDECNASTAGLETATSASSKASAPTWTIGVNYQVTPDKLLYVTSRRGFRSGGVNGPEFSGPLAALQSYGPEKVTDVEIGAKTQWRFGGVRMLFNVTAFRAKTDNVQLGQIQVGTAQFDQVAGTPLLPGYVPCSMGGTGTNFDGNCNPADDPSGTIVTYNGDSRVVKGVELQGSISPIPSLVLSGNATFYKFKFSPGTIPEILAPYAALSGITDPAQSLGARHNFTLGLRYELPFAESVGKVVFNADYYHSGTLRVATFDQTPFDLVNFRLDWNEILGSRVDLGVFVRNAFKERYALGSGNFLPAMLTPRPVSAFVAGEPRMFGVQARVRFGE